MSMAKVKTVTRAQKDQGQCEKCKAPLPAGSPYRWFKVGFRSRYKHKRCMSPACTPRPSELESSKLSSVYAAQEDAEDAIDAAGSLEDIESAMQDLAGVVSEVAEEYREAAVNPNTGVTFNSEAEERAEMLDGFASDLESWSYDGDWPDEEDKREKCEHCNGSGQCSIADEGEHGFEDGERCADCDALHEDPVCGQCEGNGYFEDDQADNNYDQLLEEALADAKEAAKEAAGELPF